MSHFIQKFISLEEEEKLAIGTSIHNAIKIEEEEEGYGPEPAFVLPANFVYDEAPYSMTQHGRAIYDCALLVKQDPDSYPMQQEYSPESPPFDSVLQDIENYSSESGDSPIYQIANIRWGLSESVTSCSSPPMSSSPSVSSAQSHPNCTDFSSQEEEKSCYYSDDPDYFDEEIDDDRSFFNEGQIEEIIQLLSEKFPDTRIRISGLYLEAYGIIRVMFYCSYTLKQGRIKFDDASNVWIYVNTTFSI